MLVKLEQTQFIFHVSSIHIHSVKDSNAATSTRKIISGTLSPLHVVPVNGLGPESYA